MDSAPRRHDPSGHALFRSRKEAGQLLAGRLAMRGYLQPVVLGLSTSGLPLAYEVAIALGAPLHVMPGRTSGEPPPIDVSGRSAILVDEAIVARGPIGAVLSLLRRHVPRRIVVAAPVIVPEGVEEFQRDADEVVYLVKAPRSCAVEEFYEEFGAVSNEDVLALLECPRLVRPGG